MRGMRTNANTRLEPKTSFGGTLLEFDFPELRIGVAEYIEGPTGCTVFCFPNGVDTAIDRRGGSVGEIGGYRKNDAFCFAGGSLYGLETATGVAAELFALRRYDWDFTKIATVSGAVIYDYPPRKASNSIYPDKLLGQAATRAVREGVFPIGRYGAGCSATVGKGFDFKDGEPSGQGGAFRQIGVTKIAVFTVVNAIGAIVDRKGAVVRGHKKPDSRERYHIIEDIERRLANGEKASASQGNTTLTLVVTDQRIEARELGQLAKQVHASMARAIQPFHTKDDGDILYAVTTNEVDNDDLDGTALGAIASEVAWDAVLSIVDAANEKA